MLITLSVLKLSFRETTWIQKGAIILIAGPGWTTWGERQMDTHEISVVASHNNCNQRSQDTCVKVLTFEWE